MSFYIFFLQPEYHAQSDVELCMFFRFHENLPVTRFTSAACLAIFNTLFVPVMILSHSV